MNQQISYCSVFNTDSSETVAYNNPLFPVYVRYGMLSSYPDYSAFSHWHNDLEFIYIIKGKMTYNVNGVLIDLPEQTGIIVNSRQFHYGFSREKEECEFICILISPELLQGNHWFYVNYIEPILNHPSYPYWYLDSKEPGYVILQKLQDIYQYFNIAESSSYFKLIQDFSDIIQIMYQDTSCLESANQKESSDLTCLRGMIRYMEKHFMQSISLSQIAASENCCKSKCSAIFQKYLSDTPITYLTKLRLKKSLVPLIESDCSITDIALAYGFCSASYYCETFHKYYQISPSHYRTQQTERLKQT